MRSDLILRVGEMSLTLLWLPLVMVTAVVGALVLLCVTTRERR